MTEIDEMLAVNSERKIARTVVSYEGKRYYISTANTADVGLETMVFKVNKNGSINWRDLFAQRHVTKEESINAHKAIVSLITTGGIEAIKCDKKSYEMII